MKRLISIVPAIIILMINPASGSASTGNRTATVVQPQTVTQNAQGRAKHKKLIKTKAQRAVPFGMDDSDEDFAQLEDLQTGYRRRDLTKIEHPEGLSEKVRWKLFLARQLALMKFRELHG